jgi:hypothetical protein
MTVTIEGVVYDIKLQDPVCPTWHTHDESHLDGTPGWPLHHHHDDKCERRMAILTPVNPQRLPFSEQRHTTPAMYRIRGKYGETINIPPGELPEELAMKR